jgi:nudix motif 8
MFGLKRVAKAGRKRVGVAWFLSSPLSSTKAEDKEKKEQAQKSKVVTEEQMQDYLHEAHGIAAERNLSMDGDEAVQGAAFLANGPAQYVTGGDIEALMKQDLKPKGWGVFRENEADDLGVMSNYFTVPALAKALRDRETALQVCAQLMQENKSEEMRDILAPYLRDNVMKRRNKRRPLDLNTNFNRDDLVILQRFLHRMPRQVFNARELRASVVIPLCNDNGVASVLFEKRPITMRKHKGEVCFPGGMVDEDADSTIIQTSLRETSEELGIPGDAIDVLGILRCNWAEVEHLTGVAVTPVVGWMGELNDLSVNPNPDEVECFFTVPLKTLLDEGKLESQKKDTHTHPPSNPDTIHPAHFP